jgi:hypothetical protein
MLQPQASPEPSQSLHRRVGSPRRSQPALYPHALHVPGTASGAEKHQSSLAFPPYRKRQPSPQSKSSSKVTSVPGKVTDATAASTKSGKASTLSRREELLKQLKAVEDAIARKRAKIPGKV